MGRYLISKRAGEYRVLTRTGTEDYGVGVRKDDADLLAADKTLGEMKKDGAAGRIATQWFGANIIK